MLDDEKKETKNKPWNQIRPIDASVHQASAQYVTASFEGFIHHFLAVSFGIHKTLGAFPELFGHALQRCWGPNEWQRPLITSSVHLGSLCLISPHAFHFLMCPECTGRLLYNQKTLLHLQSLARSLLTPEVANISGPGSVCHCQDHSSSVSLLSICDISFDSSISCAALCLFSNIKLRANCYMAKGYV